VLNLLLGFVANQQGSIRVNGQPLAEVDPASWLEQVAWVPQRAHVFLGSVRDNIQIANPAASFDAVRAAAQQAGADDFIMALPNGYDTPLGERGAGLSGGQIQRLALARAFLKDAPVLLLDEPTAHLDSATQTHIHEALRRLARGRTVLLVAHRPATARLADHIVVLDGGKVAQRGTHEALLAEHGLYRQLIGPGPDEAASCSEVKA
jgi:ATP-binding cassette subfamily C protein CydD